MATENTVEPGSSRKENLKGLWSNPRSRMGIIIMLAIVASVLIFGYMAISKQKPAAGATSADVRVQTDVQPMPGISQDPVYTAEVEKENEARLKQATEEGQSVLPTLESQKTEIPLDPIQDIPPPATPTPTTPVQTSPSTPVNTEQQQQQQQQAPPAQTVPAAPALTAKDVMGTDRYKSVEEQIGRYMSTWVPAAGAQEFAYNGVKPPVAEPVASSGSGAGASDSGATKEQTGQARFVRAGTIVPAVLLTPINSKTPGPVLAQITTGPLAGARVLGTFQASDQQVIVSFSRLSMPSQGKSFSINSVAVDSKLSTGLATDVNNHYFRRYGLLLAAGFLEGYGNAIARQNTTTTVTGSGSVIYSQGELDSSQINRAALGEVGSKVSGKIEKASNITPTIKVESKDGAGIPIGLLFMSDF